MIAISEVVFLKRNLNEKKYH